MKIRLLLLSLLFTATTLLGQNLVINPSFELTSSNCGNLGGEGFGSDLLNWNNANSNVGGDSCSSPDLFSACNVFPFIGGPSPTNMPNSALGFQYSRTGTRHAGIITYGPGIAAGCTAVGNDNYREYIQGHTTTPLVAGQTYCVSMYVSCADNVVWKTNNIGVRFTNTQYLRDACANGNSSIINLIPQLNYSCTTPIGDTVNWVRIQWDYVATGGEQYFVIGNFYNNNNTTIGCNNSGASLNPYAYYFIDDVSIVANSCCAATINPIAAVCPTTAPFNIPVTAPLGVNCNPTVTGTWSGTGITNASLGTFNPATAGVGSHVVTYTLACGATVSTTIVVSNCQTLTVCQESNGNLTVTGGTGPYQWQTSSTQQDCSGCPLGQCFPPLCNGVTVTVWTTYASTPSATPPGTFPIKVIDNAGNSLTINSLSGIGPCPCILTLSTQSTNASCGNNNGTASVNVSGGNGNYTYLWSNGGTNASVSGLAPGTYTVAVTGSNCTSTTTVTITQTGGITLTPAATTTTCGNNNGSASVSASGGGGSYTYLWSNNATTPSISSIAAGTYTVTVTGGGCTSTTTVTVPSSTAIAVTAAGTNTSCGNNNGAATTNITAGTGPYTYLWSNSATTPGLTNVAAGTYTVTVTGLGGCTGTASVTISPSTGITLTPSSTNANCNQADGSASIAATGGNGQYTYLWSNNGTGSSISNVATGAYTVTVTSGVCTATQTVQVGQNTSMTSSVTGTPASCLNPTAGSVDLTVSGGSPNYTYLWSNNAQTQDLTGVAAGTYTVTITDNAGCIITNTYEVAAPVLATSTVAVTNESCPTLADGFVNLTVTGGTPPYSYLWSTGDTTQDISGLDDGTYTVTITDGAGCTTTQTATVLPGVDFPISVSQTDSLLTATSAANYQWYFNGVAIPNANSQTYIATQTGSYFVVTSSGPCKYGSNTINVTITGLVEVTNFATINVFPNPADENINVYIELKSPQRVELNLVDMLGRKVARAGGSNIASGYQYTIPVKEVSAGMYFITVTTDTESRSFKVVVKQ